MATLVPRDLDLGELYPESERRVVTQLLSELGDDWYVVPKVEVLVNGNNAEIDIVLVSPHLGGEATPNLGSTSLRRQTMLCTGEHNLSENLCSRLVGLDHD